ncbi:hypothetical protein [Lysinibacillus sp. LZ02]
MEEHQPYETAESVGSGELLLKQNFSITNVLLTVFQQSIILLTVVSLL